MPLPISSRIYRTVYACLVVLLTLLLCNCATTYVEQNRNKENSAKSFQPPPEPYTGPKTVVAILPLGLSDRAAERYPHLLDKNVGFGIHNLLTEALYDSNRFTFVEDKKGIIKDAMDRQWMSANGMVSQPEAIQMGRMLGATKVIYGEVYDYGEAGDEIRGLSSKKT